VTHDVTQTLDLRSGGAGRTIKTADVFTTDLGSHLTTISVSLVMDGAIDASLLGNALGIAVSTSPASFDLPWNYAPAGRLHGATSGTIADTFTFAVVSPETDESVIYPGCVISEMTVTHDAGNEAGRRHASLTIITAYRPADGVTAPSGLVAYNSTFRYLREFNAVKQIAGADVVLNKVEYTISNPGIYAGFQGSSGDPEVVTRGIPEASFMLTLGVKYDANTASLWEDRRAGTTIAIELSDNATWASSTFGIKASYMKIVSEISPSGTDAGVFQDIEFKGTASTSGDIVQIVP